ncbi:sulfotransferase family protein [Alteraurantiacibacter palmitatis]|uniref:Sulfotransferase family protein n=1 Tax=Alteraurantiacibacter palmitatis TaxID=2054628 RepID=A0ABV7E7Q1_9SPHN
MTVPNLFIVGAPKCATTALTTYLVAHPDIRSMPKELHFFGSDLDYRLPGGRWDKARYEGWAANLAKTHRIVLDASVFYLSSEKAAAEIHAYNPDAKIIIMLRKPADMIRSLHQQMLKSRDEDIADFEQALAAEPDRIAGRRIPAGAIGVDGLFYRRVGSYAEQVQRYVDAFGPDQVLVILYDDLRADTRGTYERACRFIGVEPDPEVNLDPVNEAAVVRSPLLVEFQRRVVYRFNLYRLAKRYLPSGLRSALWKRWQGQLYAKGRAEAPDARIMAQLTAEFVPDVTRLEGIIGRDLSSWKV